MTGREETIRALKRARPRSRFLRGSAAVLLLLVAVSLVSVVVTSGGILTSRHRANLSRFVEEARPRAADGTALDFGETLSWAGDYISRRGGEALLATLAIAVAAIVIAGAMGGLLSLLAARTLTHPEPYLPEASRPRAIRRLAWSAVHRAMRLSFMLVRAIPEYVWAFLFLLAVGPTAWAAVLALAIHNTGILGRLSAEAVEDLPKRVPAALRGLGASRTQIAVAGVFPAVLPRFLLYFFYRFETCIRVATVLGMLGIISLGYWIEDARARNHYDEMLLLVFLGAVVVIASDLVSAAVRSRVRRAS